MPSFQARRRFVDWFYGDAVALTALVVVFLGANWQLLTGKGAEHWDGEFFFAPFFSLLARFTRSGHFLLWNPFIEGGSPDFAEPQVGALSPITLLFGWVGGPGPFGFRCYWLSLWLLGGLGMYVLARALTAPPWGAMLVSVGLIFSGFYLGHSEHTSVIYTFAFLPWIVWRLRAAMLSGHLWPGVQAGALWGLSALAGNPAIVIPEALFLALLALAWIPNQSAGLPATRRWGIYVGSLGVLAVVGIIVLAPSYGLFRYEIAGYSERSLPIARELAVPPVGMSFKWLLNLVSPMVAIATYRNPGWVQPDTCYVPLYLGAALPVFAGFALWRNRADRSTWIVALTGLFFLAIALGSTLPLRGWLYDYVPPSRFIRHPPMSRGFFTLSLAMLAASALGSLASHRQKHCPDEGWGPLAVVAGTLTVASVLAYLVLFTTLKPIFGAFLMPVANGHMAVAWIALAVLCAAAIRWQTVRRRFLPLAALLTTLDLTGAYYLQHTVAYWDAKPLPHATTRPLIDLGAAGFQRGVNGHWNKSLYTLEPVYLGYTAMSNSLNDRWRKDPSLLGYVTGSARVWFADAAPIVPATTAAFLAFQDRVHALNAPILVRHERADLLRPSTAPLGDASLTAIATAPAAMAVGGRVNYYRPDELSLAVDCPRPGFLLLTDRWSRSWTATVNGQPVPVEGGDFLFRSLPVAAGRNVVEMQFRPPWLFPLLALSWSTLAIVGVLSVWPGKIWQPKAPTPPLVGIRPALVEDTACVPA